MTAPAPAREGERTVEADRGHPVTGLKECNKFNINSAFNFASAFSHSLAPTCDLSICDALLASLNANSIAGRFLLLEARFKEPLNSAGGGRRDRLLRSLDFVSEAFLCVGARMLLTCGRSSG